MNTKLYVLMAAGLLALRSEADRKLEKQKMNTSTPAQALGEVIRLLSLYDNGSDQYVLDNGDYVNERAMSFIRQHGQHFAGLEAELRDWQNLLTAVIAPRGLPGVSVEYPKLWPFDGGQDAAMVAFALHTAIERAEAAEARCSELERGCQMLREEVEGLRAAFLAARVRRPKSQR